MRSTPHPLTAIVSYTNKSHFPIVGKSEPRALLVSSFNTITLGPVPYVSFNIKRPSSTYDAILESNLFFASGLNSARVAHKFVKKPSVGENTGNQHGWEDMLEPEGRDGNGRLKKGGIWWMQCQLVKKKCVNVGDHVVVVAKVLKAGEYKGAKGLGLIYVDGKYREAGRIEDPGTRENHDYH